MREFWDNINTQLAELRTARTADDVIRILDPPSSGDAFFAGSGGGDTVEEALGEAGWQVTWSEAHYYYVMRAPNGDMITYVEGDVYRGDVAVRG
jgi:hypothetical protein